MDNGFGQQLGEWWGTQDPAIQGGVLSAGGKIVGSGIGRWRARKAAEQQAELQQELALAQMRSDEAKAESLRKTLMFLVPVGALALVAAVWMKRS